MKVFVLPNLQLSLASCDLPSCGDSLMDGIMRLRGVLIPQGLGGSNRGYERPRWSRFQQLSANSHFGTTPSQRRLVQSLGYFELLSVGVQEERVRRLQHLYLPQQKLQRQTSLRRDTSTCTHTLIPGLTWPGESETCWVWWGGWPANTDTTSWKSRFSKAVVAPNWIEKYWFVLTVGATKPVKVISRGGMCLE